jgi:undecaprenol kinase
MIRPKQFFASFQHACRGIKVVFLEEQSFRVQVFAGLVVIIFASLFQFSRFEWVLVLLLIGSVLVLEVINSLFERIVDAFKPRVHPMVKDMKDMMAAAVLIVSCIAAAVGCFLFWPHVSQLLGL